jgi:hypothetical protein
MKTKFYVVADRDGFVRATKRVPSIYRDEVVVSLLLDIPDGCFQPAMIALAVEVAAHQVAALQADVQVQDPPELEGR